MSAQAQLPKASYFKENPATLCRQGARTPHFSFFRIGSTTLFSASDSKLGTPSWLQGPTGLFCGASFFLFVLWYPNWIMHSQAQGSHLLLCYFLESCVCHSKLAGNRCWKDEGMTKTERSGRRVARQPSKEAYKAQVRSARKIVEGKEPFTWASRHGS